MCIYIYIYIYKRLGNALANLLLADVVSNLHGFIVIVTNHAGEPRDLIFLQIRSFRSFRTFQIRSFRNFMNFRTFY